MADILERFESEEEEQENTGSYLTFVIDGCYYGFSIQDVVEIVEMQGLADLPEAPDYVAGIVSLRGNVMPVINLRRRFNKTDIPYDDRTCIVVASIRGQDVGFIVDTADEVAELPGESVSPPPPVSSDRSIRFVTGVGTAGGKTILLLDPEKIFKEDEISELEKLSQ